MDLVGRGVAWRKALHGWKLTAMHYPKQYNTAVDALTLLHVDDFLPRPDAALRGANFWLPLPEDEKLWLTLFDRTPPGAGR